LTFLPHFGCFVAFEIKPGKIELLQQRFKDSDASEEIKELKYHNWRYAFTQSNFLYLQHPVTDIFNQELGDIQS
jgi:hypothetical protein